MTKREIVKAASDIVVVHGIQKTLKRAINENTEIETEDNLLVEVGTFVAANLAADFVKPHVHNAIDRVGDWRANRKAQKAVVEVVA